MYMLFLIIIVVTNDWSRLVKIGQDWSRLGMEYTCASKFIGPSRPRKMFSQCYEDEYVTTVKVSHRLVEIETVNDVKSLTVHL